MKLRHIWACCISLWGLSLFGQETPPAVVDSLATQIATPPPAPMALRFGVDVYRIVRTQTDKDFSGFEAVVDLKVYDDLYAAVEIGSEERTIQSEQINFTTSGSYQKIGVNYNMYDNWKGMNNQVYVGLRFANSIHEQRVNNYVLFKNNPLWEDVPVSNGFAVKNYPDLNAQWLEFIAGMQVQLLHNIYLGFSLRLTRMLSAKAPENFNNLHVPGFNKVTDDNIFGVAFNYTLTYTIPFRFLKSKKEATSQNP
jgi:hypothetical protein